MTAEAIDLTAPIVAVTVFPSGARLTRRGGLDLPAGASRIVLHELPHDLDFDSVRVRGAGAFTVHGVDVGTRRRPEATDPAIAELDARRRQLRERRQEIADSLEIEEARLRFLDGLAENAGVSFARRLAGGHGADPAAFADDLAAQHNAIRGRKRTIAANAESIERELSAVERELADRGRQAEPDRIAVTIDVVAEAAGSAELDVEYVVHSASWHSSYDIRYADDRLEVTWFGAVKQHSGEDWPECELALSTARVATSVRVPELDPWFLERVRPLPPPVARAGGVVPAPAKMVAAEGFAMAAPAAATIAVADVEQGMTAATYRPVRGVAVPADGEYHRATVAVLEMSAELDYITVPLAGPEAYLRATATNSSEHTLSPGRASIFNGNDFVGVTHLEQWAPGEEVELALGIDERVRVERKLKRRTAGRGFTTSRREATYSIDVTNHTPREARVTVRDQVPVSRDEAISVKDVRTEPRPKSTSELGEVTWELTLEPGGHAELSIGFKVEVGKGVELRNWRE